MPTGQHSSRYSNLCQHHFCGKRMKTVRGGHCNLGQPVLLYLNYACPDSNGVKPKRAVLKF